MDSEENRRYRPLAERVRPHSMAEFVGQHHLTQQGQIVQEMIASKKPFSLILWGPPGSGKTTLARIIAHEVEAECIELSAVTAGLADVRAVIKHAEENQRLGMQSLLFVDEIHRFNKAQQDAFLPHVESGLITLIGATTENPSFEIIQPLLSRSRVLVLQPHDATSLQTILSAALAHEHVPAKRAPKKLLQLIAELSGGDARAALGILELSLEVAKGQNLTQQIIETAAQQRIPGYDKKGETHYNVVSAFIKSMRGGDVSATLYYLARMLQAGEDPKFVARRMVIFASEDIGIAASPALNLAIATFQAVERIGMPECQYNLYHCAVVLAGAKKSRVVADAMGKAQAAAKQFADLPVPLHVRNAPTKLMQGLGYGKGYQWQADFKHPDGFLPPELADFDVLST
jgi:putative ATPase